MSSHIKFSNTSRNKISQDIINEPHPISNLRLIKFHIPEKETKIEKLYRIERYSIQEWNNSFWKNHNEMFNKEKEEFCKKNVSAAGNSSDEMSMFYKDFLDKNWKVHCRYNVEWYKKNLYLSSLALRVNISHILKYFKLL